MVFRRIIFNALLVGLLAGFILSVIQLLTVTPIILAAEMFEVADVNVHGADSHHGSHGSPGHHGEAIVTEESWAPADGSERTLYTFISNGFAGIGFAALLLALMAQMQILSVAQLTPLKGLLWGIAGFVTFFLAPALGLPPEIPGVEAAAVEHRQAWWLMAVIGVGGGLIILAYAPIKLKILGFLFLAVPYLLPIPHHDGPAFTHPDPAVVETLMQLHQQFIFVSAASNLAFWLLLGGLSAWAVNNVVLRGVELPITHRSNKKSHDQV
ncbi:MAG: CbtA family protein [Pseudomonadales bacterium]|nr:CbtA family protein [Pseudomonadales bacterium]